MHHISVELTLYNLYSEGLVPVLTATSAILAEKPPGRLVNDEERERY